MVSYPFNLSFFNIHTKKFVSVKKKKVGKKKILIMENVEIEVKGKIIWISKKHTIAHLF